MLVACTLTMSCASDPAFQRATRIADADKSAKIALENENKLDPAKIPARTFAVLPFTVVSNDTLLRPLSFGLADMLMSDLATSPELRLVERLQVNSMLRELALVDSGRVDPHTAPRVGRLVGARRLLIGDAVLAPDGTMQLNARVVDVIGGTVQELVSAQAPLARVIDAEKQLALLVFERLGITLTPAQRTRVEQTSSAAQRASSVARVIDLSAQAINAPVINAPVAPKPPEAVDAPLSTGSVLTLIFTIRVNP
ncbi:MAG: hypothetical protein HYR75_10415 [Gemmatimonadetes bacterium]|nr:hypothetical protein [Gemmatimonadota bacterium]